MYARKNREIFLNISEIFHEIFYEIFHAKKSWNFTTLDATRTNIGRLYYNYNYAYS